ncbi:MAG: ArsR family transcriptional regulator [Rhodobacteraceae bacterium]|nr:MAG: ArsR family transcriptional regulator [Paracoccaceae bacterium]
MEIKITNQLAALAHPKRLAMFRLLMRRYPDGVPAGEISTALELKANTASSYLSRLKQVGLIAQTRTGTTLRYSANVPMLRGLFDGLLSGCCQNRPDICLRPTSQFTIPSIERPLNVLFLCSGNSARSILAETLLTSIGGGKFQAFSAGTTPSGAPHSEVLALLTRNGHSVDSLASKPLDVFTAPDAPTMDIAFTVCDQAANEECPTWPGHPMKAHWGLSDPLLAIGNIPRAIEQTYDILKNRIESFTALPFDRLDPPSLQHHLDDLGQKNTSEKPLRKPIT